VFSVPENGRIMSFLYSVILGRARSRPLKICIIYDTLRIPGLKDKPFTELVSGLSFHTQILRAIDFSHGKPREKLLRNSCGFDITQTLVVVTITINWDRAPTALSESPRESGTG
jgi:hypothetical protein